MDGQLSTFDISLDLKVEDSILIGSSYSVLGNHMIEQGKFINNEFPFYVDYEDMKI